MLHKALGECNWEEERAVKADPAVILIRLNAVKKQEYNLHRMIMATVNVDMEPWQDPYQKKRKVTSEMMQKFAKEQNARNRG